MRGKNAYSSGNTTTDEDLLRLQEHLFPRREDGTVSDHKILELSVSNPRSVIASWTCTNLDNLRVGDHHEELVSEPDRVKGTVLLSPAVNSKFGEMSKEWVGAYVYALALRSKT